MGLFDNDATVKAILSNLQTAVGDLKTITQELANAQNRQSGSAIGLARPSLGGFRFPITLPTFLDVIAMTGYSDMAGVVLIMQTATVPALSGSTPGVATTVFTTPPGYIAIADSATTASADSYGGDLYLTVQVNQGQGNPMLTSYEAPVTENINIPQNVIGATPITANLTGTWTNYGTSSVLVTVQGVMFLAQEALYKDIIQPFFKEQYKGLRQVVSDVTGGSVS